jgi:hypothetical protein
MDIDSSIIMKELEEAMSDPYTASNLTLLLHATEGRNLIDIIAAPLDNEEVKIKATDKLFQLTDPVGREWDPNNINESMRSIACHELIHHANRRNIPSYTLSKVTKVLLKDLNALDLTIKGIEEDSAFIEEILGDGLRELYALLVCRQLDKDSTKEILSWIASEASWENVREIPLEMTKYLNRRISPLEPSALLERCHSRDIIIREIASSWKNCPQEGKALVSLIGMGKE